MDCPIFHFVPWLIILDADAQTEHDKALLSCCRQISSVGPTNASLAAIDVSSLWISRHWIWTSSVVAVSTWTETDKYIDSGEKRGCTELGIFLVLIVCVAPLTQRRIWSDFSYKPISWWNILGTIRPTCIHTVVDQSASWTSCYFQLNVVLYYERQF